MFQADALMPWKTVVGNVMMGPLFHGVAKREARARATDWLRRVGLAGFEDHYPHQLSGGMRKRVALAGALINEPSVLLMDEPFGALDVQTKAIMSNELLGLWEQTRPTVIFVTHDLEEAIALADKVVVVTASPGTVKAVYDVDLPRPRGAVQEIRFGERFRELHHHIWGALREEVERAYARTATAPRSGGHSHELGFARPTPKSRRTRPALRLRPSEQSFSEAEIAGAEKAANRRTEGPLLWCCRGSQCSC